MHRMHLSYRRELMKRISFAAIRLEHVTHAQQPSGRSRTGLGQRAPRGLYEQVDTGGFDRQSADAIRLDELGIEPVPDLRERAAGEVRRSVDQRSLVTEL